MTSPPSATPLRLAWLRCLARRYRGHTQDQNIFCYNDDLVSNQVNKYLWICQFILRKFLKIIFFHTN